MALKIVTITGAYAMEQGKQQAVQALPVEKFIDTRVLHTALKGKTVYLRK